MSYSRTWAVRFSDCDPFGIAYYPQIVDALHDTSAMFVESIGWPYYEMVEHGFGLPIVEVNVEFSSPVRAGDRVEIGLDHRVGTSSLRFEYDGCVDGATVFEGFEQRVCVEVGGDESRPLPDDLRRALEDDRHGPS